MARGTSGGSARYINLVFPARHQKLLDQLREDARFLDWSDAQAVRFILQRFYSSGLTIRQVLWELGRLDVASPLGKEIPIG